MFPLHSLPETQAALALSIFLATFIYEDGATLLAATLSASGSLDPRIGLLTTFLGIWVGDMGLYGLGSSFGSRTARSRWLQKYLRSESLAKAERWFVKHGSFALVMSRAIPGSRLPLYVAAGALRLFAPWLLSKGAGSLGGWSRKLKSARDPETVGLCAL